MMLLLMTMPLILMLFWNPDRHPEPFSRRPPYFASLDLSLPGVPAKRSETVEDVARRTCSRNRNDIAQRLMDTGTATPLYGFQATGSNHPVGCYGFKEPRCLRAAKGNPPTTCAGCAVYEIASEITAPIRLERARGQ